MMGVSLRYTSSTSSGDSVNVTRNSRRLLSASTSNVYMTYSPELKKRTLALGWLMVSSSATQRPVRSNQARGRRLQLPGIGGGAVLRAYPLTLYSSELV